jgi:hypothetical protein
MKNKSFQILVSQILTEVFGFPISSDATVRHERFCQKFNLIQRRLRGLPGRQIPRACGRALFGAASTIAPRPDDFTSQIARQIEASPTAAQAISCWTLIATCGGPPVAVWSTADPQWFIASGQRNA